jgi:hypothetical protein
MYTAIFTIAKAGYGSFAVEVRFSSVKALARHVRELKAEQFAIWSIDIPRS